MPDIAWGKVLEPKFKSALVAMCGRLGCDPSHMTACMAFETGETFSPSVKNGAGSGATGLIQFMPATAKGLGTTTAALARMTATEQLPFVEKHFAPRKGKLSKLSDVYMAILMPAHVGKPEAAVLFREGTRAYEQNRGLDAPPKDGVITKAEATAKVFAKLVKGMQPARLG